MQSLPRPSQARCRSHKDSLNGGYLVIQMQAVIGPPVDRGDSPVVPGNIELRFVDPTPWPAAARSIRSRLRRPGRQASGPRGCGAGQHAIPECGECYNWTPQNITLQRLSGVRHLCRKTQLSTSPGPWLLQCMDQVRRVAAGGNGYHHVAGLAHNSAWSTNIKT